MASILCTERLSLREMTMDDLDFLALMLGDADVMRYWPAPFSREEAEAWILRQRACYAADGCGFWLALDRSTGEPVGQAGVKIMELEGNREPALGYIFHRPYWGRGLATEAAKGSLQYGFDSFNWERITCAVRPENVPSTRVAVRLGLMPDRHAMYKGFDHLIFVADRSDWAQM